MFLATTWCVFPFINLMCFILFSVIRKFLEAGKHVCVEYPMALSYKTAFELWDLARQKGEIYNFYNSNINVFVQNIPQDSS